MKKHCLECQEPVTGRSDKKFCSDDCRSRHYHKREGSKISRIRGINYILKRNRTILAKFTHAGRRSINRAQLIERGFSFEFFTHFRKTRSGRVYRYCYDQGYLLKDNDIVYVKEDRKL